MSYKFKHIEYLEGLEPLFDKVCELADSKKEPKESKQRKVYEELLNTIDQLQNDSEFIKILAVTEEKEIQDFHKELTKSPKPRNWAWVEWKEYMEDINTDLRGKFWFNDYDEERIYNLYGSTLDITRLPNRNFDLNIELHNVRSIKISRGKLKSSRIHVEIIDMHGEKMAELKEYAKTEEVALFRIDAGYYQYKYIK
ncbi:hypothetical protein COF37_26035 [Bacillus wiedmannii]|uniref:hypothetical protein n=1 Tax=Bacillus wiedmannii TaxID=1890302 RepID=UPI000BFD4600|nr:hypothetical protein [Bacillus wiedmannii]PHD18271.1 hypothetical protein COF37_26035 [Bacillus wiedmannii]